MVVCGSDWWVVVVNGGSDGGAGCRSQGEMGDDFDLNGIEHGVETDVDDVKLDIDINDNQPNNHNQTSTITVSNEPILDSKRNIIMKSDSNQQQSPPPNTSEETTEISLPSCTLTTRFEVGQSSGSKRKADDIEEVSGWYIPDYLGSNPVFHTLGIGLTRSHVKFATCSVICRRVLFCFFFVLNVTHLQRDQASILDDAIEYIKFLQMLVQMMQPMGVDFMPQRPYMSLTRQLSLQVPNLAPHTFIPLSIAMQYGIPQFGSYFPTNNVIVLPSFSQFPQLAMDMSARPLPLGQTRSIICPPLELWFPPQGSQFGNSSTRPFSHTTIHKTLSQAESTDILGQLLCRVLATTSQVIIEDHGLSLISVYDLSTSITRKLHISNHDFRPTLATKFSRLSIEKNYNNYRQIRVEEYPNIPLGTVTLNDVELWEHSVGGLHKGRIFGFGTTLDPRYATSGDSVASSSWSSHREEDWDALKEEVRQERIMKLKLEEQLRQEREAQLMLEEKYQSSRQRSQAQRIISDVEEVTDDKVMTARDLKMDFSDSYLTTTCLALNREFALVTR
ncbi:hypothetical protein OSB04_021324 [Centaurea solstitialis]|uniref:Uncharacterized protein n=1 Tax=Centaurea solstitialis TaxID=347529 RepID=A0AA38WHN7_9ASTR|nr:hypothetical protein OSB04_021324 [Centaurea solstitialis]